MHINRVTIREIMPRVCANRKICPVSVPRSVVDEQNGHKITIGEFIAEWRSASYSARLTSLRPNVLYFWKLKRP